MEKKDKESLIKRFGRRILAVSKRVFRWGKRVVLGSASEYGDGEIESPSKLLREAFFRKKSAVIALAVLIGLFLFVFIAPAFVALDVNYTDPLQQNVAPGYDLRDLPRGLKKEVITIDGFSDFSIGVGRAGKLFVWGNTKNPLNRTDLSSIPEEVKGQGVAKAAAGKDHIIAVTQDGQIVGWGDNSCGQYDVTPTLGALSMPQHLLDGVAPSEVNSLACGYQTTALVVNGEAFVWGNTNAVRNLADFQGMTGVEKIVFTNSAAVALKKDGTVTSGEETLFTSAVGSKGGRYTSLATALAGRKAVELTADNKCIALVTEDGELVVSGAFENGEDILPTLQEGEYFLSLDGGTRHFVGVTNYGNAYAWGHNAYGQCEIKKSVGVGGRAFAGSLQSYTVNADGKLTDSAGLKGYVMGTDGRGRDVFARIVHGGKMTMTVGGVAVLVSSAIAIVVGCISGYFGGGVDAFLMRITEIFSSIPFLPFAMLLSQIIKNYSVSETTRIVVIMLILGALSWTGLARMIRGQVLAEREKEFVTAARAIGVKEGRIAFRHILPNVVSVIFVSMTLDFAGCLLTESSLSYLGFGVQQPQPTWGNMLTGCNNSTVIQRYWWQWLFPALFLSVAVICINMLGDALRDALDPKSQKEK